MNKNEVFADRRKVANKILYSLREYGYLGKARDFAERPYADSEKKYRFSMANYLRLAAADYHFGHLHDPRWYTMEDISRNGWTLGDSAHAEKLEVWHKMPDGTQECEMVDFYHASDIEDKEILPIKDTSLVECLRELQAKSILEQSDRISLYDGLCAVKDYALKNGADEVAANITAQMWFAESGVGANNNVQQGLYSEALLNSIEENPDLLFTAAHRAQEILKQIANTPKHELLPDKESPFADLQVCFYWCENVITDTSEAPCEEDTVLTGAAAYEFLVHFNAFDKKSFNEKITGDHGYYKSGIDISYKDYNHGKMRIDLGDLELGGRCSVADALFYRLDMYRRNLLQNEEAAKRHWHENRENGQDITFEEFLTAVKNESDEFQALIEDFHREETAYLAQHPALVAIKAKSRNMKNVIPA